MFNCTIISSYLLFWSENTYLMLNVLFWWYFLLLWSSYVLFWWAVISHPFLWIERWILISLFWDSLEHLKAPFTPSILPKVFEYFLRRCREGTRKNFERNVIFQSWKSLHNFGDHSRILVLAKSFQTFFFPLFPAIIHRRMRKNFERGVIFQF